MENRKNRRKQKGAGQRVIPKRIAGILLLLTLILAGEAFAKETGSTASSATETTVVGNTNIPGKVSGVRTIWWLARFNKTLTVSPIEGGSPRTFQKGTQAVVIDRGYGKKPNIIYYYKLTYSIELGALDFIADRCTEGDYPAARKLYFINKEHKLASKTKYLVWTSLDRQKVNIFYGKKGKWKLIKVIPCSSGGIYGPTVPGWNYKVDWKKELYDGLYNYVEFYGSGFHQWPGIVDPKLLGQHTASYGCIRLEKEDAQWFYDTIPIGTRVVIY